MIMTYPLLPPCLAPDAGQLAAGDVVARRGRGARGRAAGQQGPQAVAAAAAALHRDAQHAAHHGAQHAPRDWSERAAGGRRTALLAGHLRAEVRICRFARVDGGMHVFAS